MNSTGYSINSFMTIIFFHLIILIINNDYSNEWFKIHIYYAHLQQQTCLSKPGLRIMKIVTENLTG